jgi:cytochrome c oxidase cbb3-type subunit III
VAAADARYGPLYAAFAAQPIPALAEDPRALTMGSRLFANNCAQCHGSDGRGGYSFPNLTDNDWLYGGDPDVIKTSILHGRAGVMPPFAPAIGGDAGVAQVTAYVLSLSGHQVDAAQAAAGKEKFNTVCIACHGIDAKGNQALGAPNLTDDIWLYNNDPATIAEGLNKGRFGKMPAHADILGEEKAHVVAAYVYSLSKGPAATP